MAIKLIVWDADAAYSPEAAKRAGGPPPALTQFLSSLTEVLDSGGQVLTTVPLSQPGNALVVCHVDGPE